MYIYYNIFFGLKVLFFFPPDFKRNANIVTGP